MTNRAFEPPLPSLSSQALARLAAVTVRPVGEVLPDNRVGLAAARGILSGGLALLGAAAPRGSAHPVRVAHRGGQVRGEWVRGGAVADGAAVLYIHGSGYAACSPRSHRGLVARLSAATGLPAFSVDYRLAPRHRFPAAADDVVRAFDWLAEQVPASRIVVAGDSAGGHLAVDLCLLRQRWREELPAALALFSPLVDVTLETARRRELAIPDPVASAASGRRLVRHYIRDVDPAHPRLTHVFEAGEPLPPTLIQAGGLEMLAEDAHDLRARLVEVGTHCELEVWPGQMHVFQAMPRVVPEAEAALSRAASFLTHHLAAGTPAAESNEELGA